MFEWLLEQPQDMVMMLLAFGAAHSVNAVEKKFTDRNKGIEQATAWQSAQSAHAGLVRDDRRQLFQARQPHDH
ncbi:hypothetical protein [Sinorhizobium meliloti]|uniref:hypothetical protein n=1 Tax=Rhizobium meliloti TaxID=382 RepID=UPI0013E3D867|nr:hypothetical protein [Sinorhizobium meliloti]MCO6425581.1 hypothetical protein [Sinorhizobium meliloti]MDX0574241.1 hypothetical protein [Sinorhizobium medicae]MDX0673040.1 hypothetical protein [Sinorhizobium medicae]MDX0710330.1 hypothetical protein [Sinorhizobium medicae]